MPARLGAGSVGPLSQVVGIELDLGEDFALAAARCPPHARPRGAQGQARAGRVAPGVGQRLGARQLVQGSHLWLGAPVEHAALHDQAQMAARVEVPHREPLLGRLAVRELAVAPEPGEPADDSDADGGES